MYKATLLSVALLFAGGTLYAKPPHAQGNGKQEQKSMKHQNKHQDRFAKREKGKFSHAEQRTFREYYGNLPPGLAKKYRRTGKLPAGWQHKVEPGMTLTPELHRLAHPVPRELIETLGPDPVGATVLRLHDRILRVHSKTREILDSFLLPTPLR